MGDPLEAMFGSDVVLDTATPILYVGKLVEATDLVFVLTDADLHDCRDGHANKEMYLTEARESGVAVNRKKIVVMRSIVISVSRLADVVTGMA